MHTLKSRRYSQYAVLLIASGALLRLAYALRGGVTYDEVFVMGVGLDEARGAWRALLFDVPLRHSTAITPLWWWVQAIPLLLRGELSLFGLRVLPVVVGTLTLVLTWRIARRRIGRGPGLILLALAALSDALAYANARGEFAEFLVVLAALPAALLVGDPRRPALKGALWLLILMTQLGKGLMLVGGLMLAESIFLALRPGRRRVQPLFVSALIALLPTLAWLLMAQLVEFGHGTVLTEAGPRDSIWAALSGVTLEYGRTKQHMIGRPIDALQVYLDGAVWPLTTLAAVPMLVGIIYAARWALAGARMPLAGARIPPALDAGVWGPRRQGSRTHGGGNPACPGHSRTVSRVPRLDRRSALTISLIPWIAVASATIIARGMLASRFHLLYLPAAWIVAACGLWRLRHARAATLIACGIVWAAYAALAFSWSGWPPHGLVFSVGGILAVIIPIVATMILMDSARRRPTSPAPSSTPLSAAADRGSEPAGPAALRIGGWALVGTALLVVALYCGPFPWEPAARAEPMAGAPGGPVRALLEQIDQARSGRAPYPPPHGRTLYIDLAHYFLTKPDQTPRDVDRAVHYAELETRRAPHDARAWFYFGWALQQAGRPTDQVRRAWQRSYEIRPTPLVAERLAQLRS